jgi:hypothetical protein
MELTPRRRRAISTLLALFLAVESVSVVAAAAGNAAAAPRATAHALPAEPPVGGVLAEVGAPARADEPVVATPYPVPDQVAPLIVTPDPAPTPAPSPKPKVVAKPAPKPAATRVTTPRPAPAKISYSGRNHVWIPSLGINRSVSTFACSRTTAPGNYVYRWGCAGANNVYLLGHAYGVFKPLHDAYVSGRLRVGMRVWYADGNGKVRQYSVRWWRLTPPSGDVGWAYAAQSVPSMTLQTCVGSNSQYRLIVRLVAVG